MFRNIRLRILIAVLLCGFSVASGYAQAQNKKLKIQLTEYFKNYVNPNYTSKDKITVKDIVLDPSIPMLSVYVSESFGGQPFTPELVSQIYQEVMQQLPEPYNSWQLMIYAKGYPIQNLVPISMWEEKSDSMRFYPKKRLFKGNPWVTPMSLPYKIENGLQGRHLCVWASHGKFYHVGKKKWEWQRPHLFCTIEDLFTQTIVVPYLIPMLENAGAVVFTTRERDWQKHEVLVDNDTPQKNGTYAEQNGKYEWTDAGMGFAHVRDWYFDHESPFEDGTARMVEAQSGKRELSTISWFPQMQQEGQYAVYVSYKTLPNSVSDATYIVRHKGINTTFRVNQQMGGGTWVYLGTFDFALDNPYDNCVMLSNQSNYRGVITADCVRFGGGMGNVARMSPGMTSGTGSGMPRCLEGSRYYAQWAGVPYHIYSPFESGDDYSDDIKGRPLFANYVARGSVYLPGDSGLSVPLEFSMGVHSDAGFRPDHSHIGTLGIYTTEWNNGVTGAGLSRLTSRDLVDMVMAHIKQDMDINFGQWTRRQMYDKNYGESREPLIPGIILETLSHQNFWDLYRGHDPYFKFVMARAIYKGILQYISEVYKLDKAATQPLPVADLAAHVDPINNRVELSWTPTYDPHDPSADPESYIIYTRIGNEGYDNGTVVNGKTSVTIDLQPEQMHYFKVAALNSGGCSMMSEEVCAQSMGNDAPRILVVNGFQRVAGPQPIDTPEMQGFDIYQDPGVVDNKMPGYCGAQFNFDITRIGKDMGESSEELEGVIVAGNTHDFTSLHANDICSTLRCNVGSCSSSAIERVPVTQYQMMDVIMGVQKIDGYSSRLYKTFTPALQQALTQFTLSGGNVMVSGAYIGSDMMAPQEQQFTADIFKYQLTGVQPNDSITTITGMNTELTVYGRMNEVGYPVPRMDIISPVEGAFPTMAYRPVGQSAAVAYQGNDYHSLAFGFPLESITDAQVRRSIFYAAAQFLLNR